MHLTVPFFYRKEPSQPLTRDKDFASASRRGSGLRILHVLRAPLGGLFRHVCDLAEEQTRMGHKVGIICDAATGGEQAEAALERLASSCALGIHRVSMPRQLGFGDIAALMQIRRHVARVAPDVLHGHGAKGGAYTRLLPRVPGRVVLYTAHGGTLHYSWRNPVGVLFLGLERLLLSRSDGILFESQYGERVFAAKVGKTRCPTRVVFNGLSQSDFAPLDTAAPTYDAVFVGELRTLKGLSTLIEASSHIARDQEFKIAIAGSGPDEAKFRAEVVAKGLERQVDFLGHRPAREVFAMARTIVVPSLGESFPYIVLEAVASARPVVATNVGGIPEIFGPSASALIAPGDAAALAKAIRSTLDEPEATEARCLALQGRAKILFSAPHMARDVTRFYSDLMTAQHSRTVPFAGPVKLPETTAV